MSWEYTSKDAVQAGVASLVPIYTGWTPTQDTIRAFERALDELDKDQIAWAFSVWAKTHEKPPTPAGIRKVALQWEPPPRPKRPGPPDHERIWAEEILAVHERAGGFEPSNRYDQSTLRTARWVMSGVVE